MKTQALKTTLAGVLLAIILFGSYACSPDKKAGQEASNQPFEMTIHMAAVTGNTSALNEHINAKSDLNEKDQYGASALHIASTFNKPEIVKLLIEAGADLNATSADGSTALHTAAFFGNKEIVELLLAADIDKSVRNNFGTTALESTRVPFDNLRMIYDQVGKGLEPLGLKLDYEEIKTARPVIAKMISEHKAS